MRTWNQSFVTVTVTLSAVAVVASLGVTVSAAQAAETSTQTRRGAHLRKAPSRAAETLILCEAGKAVEILKKKGKWARVRVEGQEGWMERAEIEVVAAARKKKAATPAPAPAVDPDAAAATTPAPEPPRDKTGWRGKNLVDGTGADATRDDETASSIGDDDSDSDDPSAGIEDIVTPLPRYRLELDVGLGYAQLTSRFDSNGSTPHAHYDYAADAAGAGVAGQVTYSLGRRVVLGADASYVYLLSSPGIYYVASDGSTREVELSQGTGSLGVAAGARLGSTRAMARVGYQNTSFRVGDVMNDPGLGNEDRHAVTLGARVHEDDALDGFTLSGWVDVLVFGAVSQDAARSDGDASWKSGLELGGELGWPVGSVHMALGYRHGRAAIDFSGASARQPDATEGSRSDKQHVLLLGLTGTL